MHVVTTTRFTDLDGCADSCSIQCDTEQTPGRHQGCSIIMHMETKGKTKEHGVAEGTHKIEFGGAWEMSGEQLHPTSMAHERTAKT